MYMKQHSKASEKVMNDFDLLRIIKLIREHSIALRALLDMPQRRFTKRLAERNVSCDES